MIHKKAQEPKFKILNASPKKAQEEMIGFVLSQGLTPFTNVDYKAYMTEHQAFTEGDEWKE